MKGFLAGLAVTAVSVTLLLAWTDWTATIGVLRSADPWLVGLAVTALVASLAAKTVRWRLLLPEGAGVSTPRLYRILHISFLLNNVLPARLGDVARVAMTSRQPGLRVGHVLSSLLTERVTDIVTLLAGFVAVSPFLPIPLEYRLWIRSAWFALAGVAVAVTAGVIARRHAARLGSRILAWRRLPGNRRLREEAASFRDGWRQLFTRRRILPIWAWSVAAWVAAFAINFFLMRALDIDAPLAVAVFLTCTTNLAMLAPTTPGYVGVFHAAATITLLPFDVGASRAVSFAVLAHLVNVLPVSLLGAAFLLWGRDSLNLNLRGLRRQAQEPGPGAGAD